MQNAIKVKTVYQHSALILYPCALCLHNNYYLHRGKQTPYLFCVYFLQVLFMVTLAFFTNPWPNYYTPVSAGDDDYQYTTHTAAINSTYAPVGPTMGQPISMMPMAVYSPTTSTCASGGSTFVSHCCGHSL